MMQKAFQAIISGRVQMVTYRDFAERSARGLEIVGMVRNLPNGAVEVIAQGREEALKLYLEKLKEGPLFARVDDIRIEWLKSPIQFSEFTIL